jgi:PKD repeat protein
MPLTVTFTNQTNTQGFPGSTTYVWDFGDGQTSTSAAPVHSYAAAGTYDVTLAATGPGGVNSLIKVAYVRVQLPGALSCLITPASIAGTARWRIAGGDTWITSGVTMTGVAPGSYSVEFLPVPGYRTPLPATVDVLEGVTTTFSVTYPKVVVLSPVYMLLLD